MRAARAKIIGPVGGGLWLLLALGLALPAAGAQAEPPAEIRARLATAHAAYAEGDYEAAWEQYRAVAAAGYRAASLDYNLGCTAHRLGREGWAVAYFEQARRRAPRDPDIRHNLAYVRAAIGAQARGEETAWALALLAGLLDRIAPADLVRLLLALVWISGGLLALHWLLPRRGRTVTRRFLLPVALAWGLVLGLGALKAYHVGSAPSGVVVGGEAQVRAGPLEGETVQFVLPPGTLVHVGRSTGAWREVWLSGEMRGWVPQERLAYLAEPRWWPAG